MSSLIKDGDIVLFQGDSVTDCNRSRDELYNLGEGYPNIIASIFSGLYPEKNITFLNRGISGNRIRDLKTRWEEDCIALKPDFVSILIGVNDTWRKYDSNDPTSTKEFEATYRYILTSIKEKLNSKIIMLEPFLLPVTEERKAWREDLDPKITVVRDLAREFADIFIPTDGILNQASVYQSPEYWSRDGVHPTTKGHGLIARAWLQSVKAL